MSYYKITTSDKKTVYQIAKPVTEGLKVYFDPFTGICEIKYSVNATKNSTIKLKKSTFSPRNVLWFLSKLGFELNYLVDKKIVEIKLPKTQEIRKDLFAAYNHFFKNEENFTSLDSLFYEGDTSIYLLTLSVHRDRLDTPVFIEAPNVVNGLILPDSEI